MFSTPLMMVLAATLLVVTAYAQYRIPFHTKGGRAAGLRLALAAIGAALGGIYAYYAAAQGSNPVIAFIVGFGLPHVPAAVILLVKRLRGEGRS